MQFFKSKTFNKLYMAIVLLGFGLAAKDEESSCTDGSCKEGVSVKKSNLFGMGEDKKKAKAAEDDDKKESDLFGMGEDKKKVKAVESPEECKLSEDQVQGNLFNAPDKSHLADDKKEDTCPVEDVPPPV